MAKKSSNPLPALNNDLKRSDRTRAPGDVQIIVNGKAQGETVTKVFNNGVQQDQTPKPTTVITNGKKE